MATGILRVGRLVLRRYRCIVWVRNTDLLEWDVLAAWVRGLESVGDSDLDISRDSHFWFYLIVNDMDCV